MLNTTAVYQETDRNYGPFKTQYQNNLADMFDRHLKAGKSVSLQPCLVSIPVFGAVDPETKIMWESAHLQKASGKWHAWPHGRRSVLHLAILAQRSA